MYDVSDVLHGNVNPNIGLTGPFRDSANASAVSLPQTVATSTGLTLYTGDVKRLPVTLYSANKIQGFPPNINKSSPFAGGWAWEVHIGRSGAPGYPGLDSAASFDGTAVLANTTTVGDVTFTLQASEDSAFTVPIDLDSFSLPLAEVVNSSTLATGLAAGKYTVARRAIDQRMIAGIGNKLLWDQAKTYAANELATYNGVWYKSLLGSNTGNKPDAAASTNWSAALRVSIQYYRVKITFANGGTSSSLTSFCPTIRILPVKS